MDLPSISGHIIKALHYSSLDRVLYVGDRQGRAWLAIPALVIAAKGTQQLVKALQQAGLTPTASETAQLHRHLRSFLKPRLTPIPIHS